VSRIDDVLREFRSLDILAARATALSGIDPRAKVLATFGFIIAVVSFDRYVVAAMLPFALFPVVLAAMGEIPLRVIARKLLIASPFALAVGIFNPIIDRTPMLEFFGHSVAGGWVSFTSILVRFNLTVAAALILVAGTGFHPVCHALSRLGVPRVFTNQLMFLHRYAELLAGEAARMSLARELRSGSAQRMSLAVYGSLLGHLLLRAFDRAERIHLAMVSRGFDGELRSARSLHWQTSDSLFLAICLAAFLLARQVDLVHMLGDFLLGRSL
jgi:cobalt/nickel transport system permease protein